MATINPGSVDGVCRRFWLQRLRWLLLLFVIICVVPGSWLTLRLQKAWQQKDAVEAILKCEGCLVYYDRHGWVRFALTDSPDSPNGPVCGYCNCDPHGCPWDIDAPASWSERLLGKYFARSVITVEIALNQVDDALPHLKRLPDLRTVLVCPRDFVADKEQDAAVKMLEKALPGIETFGIDYDFNIRANIGQPQSPLVAGQPGG